MSRHDIVGKTVRPGSLGGYSYYYSKRQTQPKHKKSNSNFKIPAKLVRWSLVLLIAIFGFMFINKGNNNPKPTSNTPAAIATVEKNESELKQDNSCQGNSLEKFIKISVDKRTLWACEGEKTVHSSAVITGLRGHAETETPVGTYKIYGKIQDTTLTGSDSRGSWRDPVSYWMPFLDNQYGTYGFHDATWRKNEEFGKVSPDSNEASHGCVELPIATSKWLYEWAPVGTTVTVIEN